MTAPFAGGSFAALCARVPPGHWASPYVGEVTHALSSNDVISPKEKQRIMCDTVTALVSFGLANPRHAYVMPQDDSSAADYLLDLADADAADDSSMVSGVDAEVVADADKLQAKM